MTPDDSITGSSESSINAKVESDKQDKLDMKSIQVLADAVSEAIEKNKGEQRFIDVSRIPLICLSMANLHTNVEEIKDLVKEQIADLKSMIESQDKKYASKLTEKIVYGLVTLILTGVAIALLSVVIKK